VQSGDEGYLLDEPSIGDACRLWVSPLGSEKKLQMTPRQAAAFVHKHGVVLESAAGPVPSLAVAIAGSPIRGSWWSHPRSHEIFELTQTIRGREDVLVCRLINGKVTFVHRRLWSALVRAAKRFPRKQLAQVDEVHTGSGHHVASEVAFPKWVPTEVKAEALRMSEDEAVRELGDWCA
jgi:hypothetical protein